MKFKAGLDNGGSRQDLDDFVDVEAESDAQAAQICAEWQINEGDHLVKMLVYNPKTKMISAWLVSVEWKAELTVSQRMTSKPIEIVGGK